MKKYFTCNENISDIYPVWSYRENTSKQLVIVYVNDILKKFIPYNVGYVNTRLQLKLLKKLVKKGYKHYDI